MVNKPINEKLYNEVKEEIYKKYPKHSLFRSAMIVKEYKKRGGKYKSDNKNNKLDIKKWFKQKWISLNDYLRGDIIKCGDSDTKKKFNEYPLCRPQKIAEMLTDEQIKKMIKKKNKLKEKQLKTEEVLGDNKFNVKSTLDGGKIDKFMKQLKDMGFNADIYLDIARRVAKREGYEPSKLNFSMNNDNKLSYDSPEGLRHFGKAGYGDFIIWTFKERNNEAPKGYAAMKRRVFRKSHKAISRIHKLGKYSPNELAINILW